MIYRALVVTLLSSGIGLIGTALGVLGGVVQQFFMSYVSERMQTELITKARKIPLAVFDDPALYDKTQLAQNGSASQAVGALNGIFQVGSLLVTVSSYVMLVALASTWLIVVLLPVVILSLVLNVRWGQERYDLARDLTPQQRETSYVFQLLTGLPAAKELRLFGLSEYLQKRWHELFVAVRDKQLTLYWRQSRFGLFNNLFGFVASTSAVLLLIFRLADSQITLGTYMAVFGAFSGALGLMPRIALSVSQVYEQSLHMNDFTAYLQLPENSGAGTRPFPDPLREGIVVEKLSFRYFASTALVLNQVSFAVSPGERVAIVGENGSGKTTLVKCLLGLYDAESGSIRYDGLDIRDISPSALNANVTAVFQDFMQYMLTVQENVGLANPDRMDDLRGLESVGDKVGINQFVNKLPKKWNTRLGRLFPGGTELSYGQWQRIAIGRALFRDAQVIVLDEPTASLDPKAEAEVNQQFLEMTRGRTSFMISHRLGMARLADRILVLKNGVLVEQGSHEQLLELGGEYARMFSIQSAWYKTG